MSLDRHASPFVVELRLEERSTGRTQPITVGYRASVALDGDPTELRSAVVTAMGPTTLVPGAAGVVVLEPLVPSSWRLVRTGDLVAITEGLRVVGRARVLGRPHWRTLEAAVRETAAGARA